MIQDSVLNRFYRPGTGLEDYMTVLVLALIIFCMVWVSLQHIDLFPRRAAIVLSVCVTLLALMGITEDQLQWICRHYASMSLVLLIMLAAAIRGFWVKSIQHRHR